MAKQWTPKSQEPPPKLDAADAAAYTGPPFYYRTRGDLGRVRDRIESARTALPAPSRLAKPHRRWLSFLRISLDHILVLQRGDSSLRSSTKAARCLHSCKSGERPETPMSRAAEIWGFPKEIGNRVQERGRTWSMAR